MTTTIKTVDEFLAMRDAGGIVRVDGDLHIECSVPWHDAGENVSGLLVTGNLYCCGNLYCRGYLNCVGNLDCLGYLYCGGNLYCRGYLYCRGDLYCGGNLDCRGDLYCGGYLYCLGYLDCGGDCAVSGIWYWPRASMPRVGGRLWHRLVLPADDQRDHWSERLCMDLSGGCYENIIPKVVAELPRLLRSRKWSSTERWILESLTRENEPEPEWVIEMRAAKDGAK